MSDRIEQLDISIQSVLPAAFDHELSLVESLAKINDKVNELVDEVNDNYSTGVVPSVLEDIEDEDFSAQTGSGTMLNGRLDKWEQRVVNSEENIGSRTYTENNYVTDSESVTASIDALDVGVTAHLAENIGTRTYTEQNYVTDNESVTASIDALDVGVAAHLADYASIIINAKYPPSGYTAAVGDGVTDDAAALQALIDYCFTHKTNLYIPEGIYLVSVPLNGASGIKIFGQGGYYTIIKKTSEETNARGVDAVMDIYLKNNFEVSNLQFWGNRTDYASGNTVSVIGMNIEQCSYFNVKDMRFTDCKRGLKSITSYCCAYDRLTGLHCQEYAFTLYSASTSTILSNCTAWGCGGAFDIQGTIYTTIINPACDHNCAGGRPDDPFLPEGSGGNYLAPEYVFKVVASKVTIISPGTENSYSQYIYGEGADITLLNPYIYNMLNYADTYRFIELRGTGVSNLEIVNANFTEVSNERTVEYTRCGFYIETPNVQKVKTNKFIKLNDNFGAYEYPVDGMEYSYKTNILNLNQYSMKVGDLTQFIFDNTDSAVSIVSESDVKKISFTKTSETPYIDKVDFKLLLPSVGQIVIDLDGYYSSSYAVLSCKIIETDGVSTTNILKSFTSSGDFSVRDNIFINSAMTCYLLIEAHHSTDVLKFSRMDITQIK